MNGRTLNTMIADRAVFEATRKLSSGCGQPCAAEQECPCRRTAAAVVAAALDVLADAFGPSDINARAWAGRIREAGEPREKAA